MGRGPSSQGIGAPPAFGGRADGRVVANAIDQLTGIGMSEALVRDGVCGRLTPIAVIPAWPPFCARRGSMVDLPCR